MASDRVCTPPGVGDHVRGLVSHCPPYGAADGRTALRPWLGILRRDLQKATERLTRLRAKGCFGGDLQRDSAAFRHPPGGRSRFMPEAIWNEIQTSSVAQVTYRCPRAKGDHLSIVFTLSTAATPAVLRRCEEDARQIYLWSSVCREYGATKCARRLTVYMYPTKFRKKLPEDPRQVLGPEHANTAYATVCAPDGHIVLYRREEWLKVFIHESFHAYGFDEGLHGAADVEAVLANAFPGFGPGAPTDGPEFNVGEAYTETWARILNCVLHSHLHTLRSADSLFFDYCYASLQLERVHSLYRMQQVLEFMGLSYADITDKDAGSVELTKAFYRENTAIFGYYVLGGVMMSDFIGFMSWCGNHNPGYMKFGNTAANRKALATWIARAAERKNLLSTLRCLSKAPLEGGTQASKAFMRSTMRMTFIDHACYGPAGKT